MPKDVRDKVGIKPGSAESVKLVSDDPEMRSLPDDPIEFLTGIFKEHPTSLAAELLDDRRKDDEIDEADAV